MPTPADFIKEETDMLDRKSYRCTNCFERFTARFEAEYHAKMHSEKLDFSDWKERQTVEYSLTVTVNDFEVFSSTYANIEDLYGEGRKPERSVDHELNELYDNYCDEFESDDDDAE